MSNTTHECFENHYLQFQRCLLKYVITSKMQDCTETMKNVLERLLPLSIIKEVACFVFYDNHPRDDRRVDITICTKTGELREYFQRDLVSCLAIKVSSPPTKLIIFRNSSSLLFYVMGTKDNLYIVSTLEELKLFKKIKEVDSFEVDAWNGYCQVYLKVLKKYDAVPIYFDDDILNTDVLQNPKESKIIEVPRFIELKRKYIEAKHCANNHEKTIREYIKLRHAATLCAYQDVHPNDDDSLFKISSDVYGSLKVKTKTPWVKICNSKLIVALNVLNDYKDPIEDLHILLNTNTSSPLVHSSKVFSPTDLLPFWKEDICTILPNAKAAVVVVIALSEIQKDPFMVQGCLSYKVGGKSYLLPFEELSITTDMICGDTFDVLSLNEYDSSTMLAIVSATQNTDLRIRLLEPGHNLIDLLTQYLQMEKIAHDVVLYKKSPYHALNGAMLHVTSVDGHTVSVNAYTRTKCQLLRLIQCINKMIPAKIIVTPAHYNMHTKIPSLAHFSENLPNDVNVDYHEYAKTMLNRTNRILEYLDYSMVKMGESKDPNIREQIGLQIDLYSGGKSCYNEFRDYMIEEHRKGVKCWTKPDPKAMDM